MDNSKEQVKEKSSKKIIIISIIAVLLLIGISVGAVFVFQTFFSEKPAPSSGVVGQVSADWDPGIEDSSKTQTTGVQIPGYAAATMNEGDTSLHLSIGNPKANQCGFYATLKLDDGTVLYESELLKPGYGLTEVPLLQTLEKGEYGAMVVYQCVTLDEAHKPMNSAESEFKLIVK